MRVLDAALRVVRWLLVWTCIPGLIVCVYLAAGWVEHVEQKSQEQEKRLTVIELRLDRLEMTRHFDMIEVENLADKILNTCITDTPRPLKKQKGRKH
jgi:hypothetical protein